MKPLAVTALVLALGTAVPAIAQQGETLELSGYVRVLRIQRDQAQEAWAQAEGRIDALRTELSKAREEIKKLSPKADEAKPAPLPDK